MNNLLKYADFIHINEGKIQDVTNINGRLKYRGEFWDSFNVPKRYVGKKNYKYRVLAKEGEKVKPINFGTQQQENYSKLNKKYNRDPIPTKDDPFGEDTADELKNDFIDHIDKSLNILKNFQEKLEVKIGNKGSYEIYSNMIDRYNYLASKYNKDTIHA